MIPVCRPLLPPAERLVSYLKRADAARRYTNHGELNEELRARLGEFFGLDRGNVAMASSGTAALIGALLATAGRAAPERPLCICPAYSFVATAVAAANCGYVPFFADVDPSTWCLDPRAVASSPQLHKAGAVIAVGAYGRPPDLKAWGQFQDATGVAVVIDAAACFDTLDKNVLAAAAVPVALSLHATKTLSTAEGGVILSADREIIRKAERALNFGFLDNRESSGPSTNGKLSEYHAAVGLADFDQWTDKRGGFIGTARAYRAAAEACGLGGSIIGGCGNANPYVLMLAKNPIHAARIEAALLKNGIDSRKWYGLGLHRQPEFQSCGTAGLAVTDDLAPRLIGLPCFVDLTPLEIEKIVGTVAAAPDVSPSSQPSDFT